MFNLKSELSLISINARGLRDLTKRKSFFLFCKGKNANLIFLQETHSKQEDTIFWSKQWGDETYFCHGSSRSAGVAILLKNFQGQIISSKMDENGHWLFLTVCLDNVIFILLNIYGYNNQTQNKLFLEEITLNLDHLKSFYSTNNIIIGGDLNLVHDEFFDKWPSKHNSSYLNKIFYNFCSEQNLVDVWRHLNPNCNQFSWFGSNSKSRLDYWLITNELLSNKINSDISAAPLTDHSLISLQMKPQNWKSGTSKYWKFNCSLLKNDTYCQKIKDLIQNIKDSEELSSPVQKWEFLKYKIRQFSISFSKQIKKELQKKELDIVQQLNLYCNKPNPSMEDKEKIRILQPKLDEMYIQRAKGFY